MFDKLEDRWWQKRRDSFTSVEYEALWRRIKNEPPVELSQLPRWRKQISEASNQSELQDVWARMMEEYFGGKIDDDEKRQLDVMVCMRLRQVESRK